MASCPAKLARVLHTAGAASVAGGLRIVHEGREVMKFGAGFALTAQADPVALRDMAQTLDEMGFDYVTTAGHLLCAPPDSHPGRPQPTYVGPFREPFVFFSYLAAVTQRLAFRTSILRG